MQVLELTEAEQTFVFDDVKEPCVASLFRDFSAPVRVSPWLTDEDTAFLMAYDSDAFNKWEAANALARKLLLQRAKHLSSNGCNTKDMQPLSEVYRQAFKTALLDPNCDQSIKVRQTPNKPQHQIVFLHALPLPYTAAY